MTPTRQTVFTSLDGSVRGNCFRACVASLTDMKLEDVPDFRKFGDDWGIALIEFLEGNGYEYDGIGNSESLTTHPGVDGYFIVSGKSTRKHVISGHSVIYKNDQMVFDPHPENSGIVSISYVMLISRKTQK